MIPQPLTYVSASQIQLYMDCPRKWYNTYVLGMRQPSTPAQILGTDIHTQAENFLKFGIEPDQSKKAGQIFSRGIHLLPKPKECVVEHGFECKVGGSSLPIKGFIDVYYQEGFEFIILDHKTSSSKRWIKSEAELAINPQLITYAAYAFENLWDEDDITVSHVYYGTKQSFSQRVDVRLTRHSVFQLWRNVVEVIDEMVACHAKNEYDVRQKFSSCSMYGGCEFQSRCATPQKENQDMTQGTLDALLRKADSKSKKKPSKGKDTVLTPAINPPEADEQVIPIEQTSLDDQEIVTITEPSVEDVPVETKPYAVPSPKAKSKVSRVLFIKCFPSKDLNGKYGKVQLYSDLVAPIQKAICEQYDVPHISLVGQYGDGYKMVAAAVAQQGWSEDHPTLYINPIESKGSEHVLDVLIALADEVIKG